MATARHGLAMVAMLASLAAIPQTARAEVSAKLAVCPWNVTGASSEISAYVRELGLKGAQGLDLVPPASVAQAIAEDECELAVESLAPVALKTGAAYALFAQVKLGSRVHIAWRLVDRGGRVASPAPVSRTFEAPRPTGDLRAGLAELIRRFYAEEIRPAAKPIPVDTVATDERVASADDDVLAPLVPSKPAEIHTVAAAPASPAPPTLKWAGVTTTALGVGSLISAGALALSVRGEQEQQRAQLDPFGQLPATDENRSRFDSLQQRAQLTTGLLVAGTVLAAGGALLWWLAPGKDSAVAATVLPGGGAVTAAGRF